MSSTDSEFDEEPADDASPPAAAGSPPTVPLDAVVAEEIRQQHGRAGARPAAVPFETPPQTAGSSSVPADDGDDEGVPDVEPDDETVVPPEPEDAPSVPDAPAPVPDSPARPRPGSFASASSAASDARSAELDRPSPRSARALPPAPIVRRLAAHVIDRLLVVPVMALVFLLSEAAWIRSDGRYFVSVEAFVAAWFAGGWLVAWIGDGLGDRTLGRRLTGIRLVTDARGLPTPFRVFLHRVALDGLVVVVMFASLWLTMWRQGADLADAARPLAFADVVVWLVFVANLLVGLLLLRQMNPGAGFVHDRLLGLRVVPGNILRARPPAAEPEHAAPAARPKLGLRQARTTVPSYLRDEQDDVLPEPPPRPSVVRDLEPEPGLDAEAGVDQRSGPLFWLAERVVDSVGFRIADDGFDPEPPRPVPWWLRVMLAPVHWLFAAALRLGLRPPRT